MSASSATTGPRPGARSPTTSRPSTSTTRSPAPGLTPAAFDATSLGRPDAAGIPPEGGVLLAWRDGATTLWVRSGEDDIVVVKKLVGSGGSELIDDLGDYAVLIDDDHVLDTPARRVAAGRVLWWLDEGRQWRLESDLDAATMLAVGRALAAA